MDLMLVLGGGLLLWIAYKVGLYVEHKMKDMQKAHEAKTDAKPDSERKP